MKLFLHFSDEIFFRESKFHFFFEFFKLNVTLLQWRGACHFPNLMALI